MFRLFVSFYQDINPVRQRELNLCLKKNIECRAIDEIFVLLEYPIENELLRDGKVKIIYIRDRPMYSDFFEIINSVTGDDDWNIIANSDIYFDQSLLLVKDKTADNCFALTRWDVTPKGISFLNRRDSQDCWMVRGRIRNVNGDFCMGTAGCDNAIAFRFEQARYRVSNPSRSIKTYHVHNSGVRNYDVNKKVPMPYRLLIPTDL